MHMYYVLPQPPPTSKFGTVDIRICDRVTAGPSKLNGFATR